MKTPFLGWPAVVASVVLGLFFYVPHTAFATGLPALTSALITEHTVVLTYDKPLNTTPPSTSDFGITDVTASASVIPSSISISGARVVLSLPTDSFSPTDTLTLDYNGTVDFHAIQDKYTAGNDAVNLAGQALTNDIGAFVTTWTVTDGETVAIPTYGGNTYNYGVDWGDSSSDDTGQTGNDSHTYTDAGSYTVTITGTFPRIYLNGASDAPALTDIQQWGTNHWDSMAAAFSGCTGLTALSATDAPDLSGVNEMSEMFAEATHFNSDISSWDVSNVTDLAAMFRNDHSFNNGGSPLTWGSETSNVIYMNAVFLGDTAFNQNIGDWNTANVVEMGSMFNNDTAFNQDISAWNVSNVTDMDSMFSGASDFNNGDLGNDHNHPLLWGSQTSKVTDMGAMFGWDYVFNQDIGNWDTSNVTTMYYMFYSTAFNQNIGSWNIEKVTDMTQMFGTGALSTTNYDALLAAWSLESVQPNVTLGVGSSAYCSSGAITGRGVLAGVPHDWTIQDGGHNCSTVSAFVTTWTATAGETVTIPTNPGYAYDYSVDWGDSTPDDTDQAADDNHTYTNAGSYTVTITGTFPAIYFNNASDAPALTDIDQWGANHWQSMANAFEGCTGLTVLSATDAPDLSGVTDMGGMFWGATSFNQNISSWNVQNVTNMNYLFESADSFNQDLSSWNVGSVTSMYHMFNSASNFNNGDSGNDHSHPLTWGSHVSQVTDMESMFYYDYAFNQDIASWDVSSVTDTGSMFQGDVVFNNGGQPLAWGANTAHVTTMSAMFIDDTGFNQDISSWDVRSVTDMSGMFIDDALSSANYDALLVAWSAEPVQPSVTLDAGNSPYCSSNAAAGKTILTNSPNNWTINDAGTFCGGNAFVTTWNTQNPGIDDGNQITIPTFSGDTYNYNVDWGDGTSVFGQTGDAQHAYSDPGIYTVKITGTFPRIYFNDGGSSDAQKIISVEQWGTNHWDSMVAAFAGCVNLVVNATDAPDLSGVTDASYMFLNDASLNQNLSSWNTSTITNMYGMFQSTMSFNQPLDTWNTSRVTDMSVMFSGDSAFNQPLNSWNVSSVTNMDAMFVNTDFFNQPLDHWNVSKVTDMGSMFKNNTVFDQDISSWDVSHVTSLMNFFQIGSGGLSSSNYGKLLHAWSQESLQSGLTFVAGTSKYCPSAAVARTSIMTNFSWGILDGGPSTTGCTPPVPVAVPSSADTASGGGVPIFGCKDPKATNYDYFSTSNPSLCTYASTASASAAPAVRILTVGMRGDDVKALQRYLDGQRFAVPVTGLFGPKTKKAVQRFQKMHRLDSDGAVGSRTRSLMK